MRTQQCIEGHAAGGQRGFTMIEMLVTVAIAVILAGIAIPSLSGFVRNNKLNAINSALVGSLQQARSEAIKLNRGVLVCPSNALKNDCDDTAPTNWGATGWLVCYDLNNNLTCDASSAALPNPIKVENPVDTTFATVTGPAAAIRFTPSGAVGSSIALSITGKWSPAPTINITVAPTGLVKGQRLP